MKMKKDLKQIKQYFKQPKKKKKVVGHIWLIVFVITVLRSLFNKWCCKCMGWAAGQKLT